MKYWKWVAGSLLVLLALGIYFTPKILKQKRFNRFVTYSTKNYNPYNTKFFYETLKKYGLDFSKNFAAPNTQTLVGEDKVYVICTPEFHPNNDEKTEILKFASYGNHVFLSSFKVDETFVKALLPNLFIDSEENKPFLAKNDSLEITWQKTGKSWSYPGSAAHSQINFAYDSTEASHILTTNIYEYPSLIGIPYGRGKVYIELHPMTLTNYFLLHKNNYAYLETLLEELDITNREVIWDEYYKTIKPGSNRKSNDRPPKGESFFLQMLKNHPSLQWAVFTFIAGAILFLLNASRRLRRPIGKLPDNQNASLGFTQAIAELYWQRQDHSIIAHKIQLQLQDYLYANYKIHPKDLNNENAEQISIKTGRSIEQVSELLQAIKKPDISDQSLLIFYRVVYKFIYK